MIPPRPRTRKLLPKLVALAASLAISAGILEGSFSCLESREQAKTFHTGSGGVWVRDPRWGWKLAQGDFSTGTAEFAITGSVNALWMNDVPVGADADRDKTRVLALGDSHTMAVGVSLRETWPKVLERRLGAGGHAFRAYNGACSGYNLHQYLLRLIDQGPLVKPHYVVVGLSYATDLFDLLPPDRGGWTYGWTDQPRDYFDFDAAGALAEHHWEPPAPGLAAPFPASRSSDVRAFVSHFATFRFLRRSSLALAIGSHVTVGGQSLWPNMAVVLEKEVSPEHAYQWRLAEALLVRIKEESERQKAKLIVVGIPYLPQVYDEIWSATFGDRPEFSRTAAIERMAAFCKANGIAYVDTLDAFRKKRDEVKRWLHFRKDAHPTPEGQEVIAEVIEASGLIAPVQ